MEIRKITENKKQYLSLMLLATDGQENALEEYLDRGDMYVLDDDGVKCQCIVTDEGDGILEIKNIATLPEGQGKGYGKKLINYVIEKYKGTGGYSVLQVGTGDSPMTVPFYEKCGFVRSHVVKNYFIDHYDKPIFECGIQLVDMVYLSMNL